MDGELLICGEKEGGLLGLLYFHGALREFLIPIWRLIAKHANNFMALISFHWYNIT